MHYEIQYRPAHALALVHLQPGESVRAEARIMDEVEDEIADRALCEKYS